MWYNYYGDKYMELNKIIFLLSLAKEQIPTNNIVSFEAVEDSIKLIIRKNNNTKSLDNYIEYAIKNNDNYISITKNDNICETYYDFSFHNILNRYFCEIYVDSKKYYRYEFNYNILSKRDNYNDAIKDFNIINTKRR